MPKPEQGFRESDLQAGACAGACVIVYLILKAVFPSVDTYLNICVMTIAAAFLAECSVKKTFQAALSRLAIVTIGAVVGCLVVLIDNLLGQNDWVLAVIFAAGMALTLVLAKLTGKMYVACKTSAVSYSLTVYTFRGAFYEQMGKTRYGYGLMFVLSTVLTGLICVGVIFIWRKVRPEK